MGFKECLERGSIKKHLEAKARVDESLKISEKFLKSSEKNFNIEEYEMSVIASYNSIFHCCRALLFNKGYIEKSHYCLIISVEELYNEDLKLKEFLKTINKIRLSRHEVQYRGEMSDKEEAKFILNLTKEFLNYSKNKLNKKN